MIKRFIYDIYELLSMDNPFLKEKKALLLMNLLEGETYIRPIAEKSNTMYSYALLTLQTFEQNNLVTSEKEGRIRIYSLTNEGKKIAELVKELWELTGPMSEIQKEREPSN